MVQTTLSVVASGDVVVAVGGQWGTLSEIGLAGTLGRPVVLLKGWRLQHEAALPSEVHYADTPEYATGHGVSADWDVADRTCRVLRTAWIPSAQVEKTETVDVAPSNVTVSPVAARFCDLM